MQFEHSGKQYRINFHYDTCHDRLLRKARTTVARILCYSTEDSRWVAVGYGRSICVASDHFEKEKGRKLALSRALADWDRVFRTVAWKAYHSRPGGLLAASAVPATAMAGVQ